MISDLQLAISLAKTIEALYANDIAPNVTCAATDTQCLVEEISPAQVLPTCSRQSPPLFAVIFPGTASLRDWLTDARIKKGDWPGGGKVHVGFRAAFDSVWLAIQQRLPSGARVIVAGHSLGGALATLCADGLSRSPSSVLHLPGANLTLEQVITFGSPRLGNGPFARQWNDRLEPRSLRFVNAGDPVPHVPWVFGTYRHVGGLAYLTADGELERDAPWRALYAEWSQTVRVVQDPPAALAFAADHGIRHYRKKLEALRP